MFGSSSAPISEDAAVTNATTDEQGGAPPESATPRSSGDAAESAASSRKSSVEDSTPSPGGERKRRSSGVSRARDMFSSAKQSLHLHGGGAGASAAANDKPQSPIQKLSKTDPALGVPQGSHNNSAGESAPTARSTFHVGVTEDKNKKCRRTMEDTHAYLYNFLSTPAAGAEATSTSDAVTAAAEPSDIVETDNGYFAIFDGHAGTFAADWCGKKLHHVLEDTIRKNPNTPIPELLDQTFTSVDQQLEKLPLKNSGTTAVIAVLRWEDRVPNPSSATGSTYLNQAAAKASTDTDAVQTQAHTDITTADPNAAASESRLRESATRQRVLYTANVGDARIVLCRNGRALRLSYDHKGSDENEGRRVANAGGLILNNRVNGVLAVTRALGDTYMKDLVTGHPYTTETVIQPDQDEFIILACDGLWDVCTDQEAVDLIRTTLDPQTASKQLVDHALARFSTDNLSCMIVRFDNEALKKRRAEATIGVDSSPAPAAKQRPSEAQAIVGEIKRQLDSTGELAPAVTGTAAVEAIQEETLREQRVDPGPELNAEALKAAREKKERNAEKVASAEG